MKKPKPKTRPQTKAERDARTLQVLADLKARLELALKQAGKRGAK